MAPPPPIPRLYDGWGAEWSAQHERWYFVNNHTQETTWDKPTGPAPGVESKVACSEETGDNNAAKEKGQQTPIFKKLPKLTPALDYFNVKDSAMWSQLQTHMRALLTYMRSVDLK